jgi:putative inorganic carbon (HCO3(-)) transporter
VVIRKSNQVRGIFRRWDWLLIAVLAPLMLFPQPGMIWSILLFPLILFVQWWAWAEILPVTPLNPAILLMGVMTGVSLFVTPDLLASLGKVTGVLLGMLVFFTVVRHGRTKTGWNGALGGYALAGLGTAAIGLIGTNWSPSKFTGLDTFLSSIPVRISGLPGAEQGINVNELAGSLLWIVPLVVMAGVALLLEPEWFIGLSKKRIVKHIRFKAWAVLLGIAIIICAGVLVISQSRDGYLALAVACPLLILIIARGWLRYLMGAVVVAVTIVAVMVISHAETELVLNQVFGILPAKGAVFSVSSMFGRVDIWSRAVNAIREAPLTGLGMNIFRKAVYLQIPPFPDPGFDIAHAHNELLTAALDIGIPGLVGFLALNFGAIGMLMKPIRNRGAIRTLALGLLGGLMAHFLFGLTDTVALGAKPGFLLWWLLALIVSLHEHTRSVGVNTRE